MDPNKPKELITEFCALKGYDESIIQVIVDECYREIRKVMEQMNYDYIEIPGIGDLFLKVWSVKRRLVKLQSLMDANHSLLSERIEYEKMTMV